MVYALDAKTGKVRVGARSASRRSRSAAGTARTPTRPRRRSPTASGSTSSFGQNVGLFCYTLDGTLVWKKQWPPQPIYLDFGTASSPIVHRGRVTCCTTTRRTRTRRRSTRERAPNCGARHVPNIGLPKSSWTTPFVWEHDKRTEIVTTGHGMVLAYDLDGREIGASPACRCRRRRRSPRTASSTSALARRVTPIVRSWPSGPAQAGTSR